MPSDLEAIHADLKARLEHFIAHAAVDTFASAVCSRVRVTDVQTTGFTLDEDGYAEASRQATCTITCEIVVEADMVNSTLTAMHGGCGATLMDMCSSMPIYALARGDKWQTSGVSSDVRRAHLDAAERADVHTLRVAVESGRDASVRCNGACVCSQPQHCLDWGRARGTTCGVGVPDVHRRSSDAHRHALEDGGHAAAVTGRWMVYAAVKRCQAAPSLRLCAFGSLGL